MSFVAVFVYGPMKGERREYPQDIFEAPEILEFTEHYNGARYTLRYKKDPRAVLLQAYILGEMPYVYKGSKQAWA